jgi:hypothetical protein
VLTVLQVLWAVLNLHGVDDKLRASEAALAAGDFGAAEGYAHQAHAAAERAEWATWGPHFRLAEHLPVVGGDVQALRAMASVGAEFSGPVADRVFAVRRTLDPSVIKPVHGRVDVARFREAQAPMGELATAARRLDDRVTAVDDRHLIGPLAGAWDSFAGLVDHAATAADYTHGVLQLLPDALGQAGRRRYLVIFQNNAELRATGGIPGAFAVLTADHGRLSLGQQGVSSDLGELPTPVVPLTGQEEAIYSDRLAEWPQDVNLTPDFPRSGQIISAMFEKRYGERVDGVISVDPVVLASVLEGTGPVPALNGVTLSADNAVPILLNGTYLYLGTDTAQNYFFSDACRRVFAALVAGQADAGKALKGVYDGVLADRVDVWMARPAEQERIAGERVTGELTPKKDSPDPAVGVFLNDSTGTKLDYYVASTTDVTSASCTSDGRQRLEVTTTLVSRVPKNAAELPPLLRGAAVSDQPGDVLTSVFAYGPVGAKVLDTTLQGKPGSPATYAHDGHPVVARTVLLPKGGTLRLTWAFETAAGQPGDPTLRTTPGAQSNGIGVVGESSC